MARTAGIGLATIIAAVLLAGCRAADPPPAPARPVLRVATAFAPFSTRLIEEYRRTMPDIDIRDETLPASGDVLSRIQAGTLDLGVALADDAYRAYFGETPSTAPPNSAVRAISLLQPLPTYLLARTGSGVHSVAGRRNLPSQLWVNSCASRLRSPGPSFHLVK